MIDADRCAQCGFVGVHADDCDPITRRYPYVRRIHCSDCGSTVGPFSGSYCGCAEGLECYGPVCERCSMAAAEYASSTTAH